MQPRSSAETRSSSNLNSSYTAAAAAINTAGSSFIHNASPSPMNPALTPIPKYSKVNLYKNSAAAASSGERQTTSSSSSQVPTANTFQKY